MGPLNSNKNVMFSDIARLPRCLCSLSLFPHFTLIIYDAFTCQSRQTTFPYLFLHTISYKGGRRWREGGRMHSHSSLLAIHLCPTFVCDSLFILCHLNQGLLSPTNSLFCILSNVLNFCGALHRKAHLDLWEPRVLQGTGSLWLAKKGSEGA